MPPSPARLVSWVEDLQQDVRHAVRSYSQSPALALALVLTFALGIGVNTAIFSVLHGVLLRPLPYRASDRLVIIQREQDLAGANRPVPVPFFEPDALQAWSGGLRSLESAALYSLEVATHATAEGTELLDVAVVSGSFFPALDGPLAAGRGLDPPEDLAPSVVISERLARHLFATPAAAMDQTLALSDRSYTIVGVAAADFRFPAANTDVWMPAGFMRSANPRCCGFRLVGRLDAGVSPAQASIEAATFARAQAAASPDRGEVRANAVSLLDSTVASARPALLVLMAAAGLMLLVACANIVNLLVARRWARSREIATRVMLGASRARLARQSVTETLLVGAGGGVVGVMLADVSIGALARLGSAGLPRVEDVRTDVPVLLFASGVTILAALVTGVLPAVRSHETEVLHRVGTGMTAPPVSRWLRRSLCVAELALSLVLLIGASLLARSFVTLMRTELGVAADGVVTASLNFGMSGPRRTDEEIRVRAAQLVSTLEEQPGVTAAGVGTSLPPNTSRIRLTLRRPGESRDYQAAGVAATPGYFAALGMRLVSGRLFTSDDDLNHPPVMIMSVDTARRFFGDGDPIGRTMTLPVVRNGTNASEEMALVGVVASVRYSGLDATPDDAVYRPFAQQTWGAPFLVVRTEGDAEQLATSIRRHIAAVDPAIVTSEVRTLSSIVSTAAAGPRFRTVVLAAMAGLAVLIAGVGLYGVVAFSVTQRTREIGVRVAIGASRRDVLALIMREGFLLGAAGAAIGLGLALLTVRLLVGLLYGVDPVDPLSFIVSGVGLLALTLLASYLPARRAAGIDPVLALRSE